jgi:hypothetical protein
MFHCDSAAHIGKVVAVKIWWRWGDVAHIVFVCFHMLNDWTLQIKYTSSHQFPDWLPCHRRWHSKYPIRYMSLYIHWSHQLKVGAHASGQLLVLFPVETECIAGLCSCCCLDQPVKFCGHYSHLPKLCMRLKLIFMQHYKLAYVCVVWCFTTWAPLIVHVASSEVRQLFHNVCCKSKFSIKGLMLLC